jgi:DNA polymerase V
MYALVDCNNFYASCERLFQPKLQGKPVVVLSNNDGCVIARSEEAKQLGIAMGTPAFQSQSIFTKHQVAVFSSNYTLYGDMSNRVMGILASFVPALEVYSIDEAFLDMTSMKHTDLFALAVKIRSVLLRHTGITVSIGIAPSKALAKMANRYAKKKENAAGVYYARNKDCIEELILNTAVGQVWGIGGRLAVKLKNSGVYTAKAFTELPGDWVRNNMSVTGLRLWNELKGNKSLDIEAGIPAKRNICTSRSLGKPTNQYDIIEEAICNHAATCARKLRAQQTVCRSIEVFIATNPHNLLTPQHSHSIILHCSTATNNTGDIIAYAIQGLKLIYKKGEFLFMKCGVMVLDLVSEDCIQTNLFESAGNKKQERAMEVFDNINTLMGKGTVRMAVQGFAERYRLKAAHLSPRYTTRMDEILKIKI